MMRLARSLAVISLLAISVPATVAFAEHPKEAPQHAPARPAQVVRPTALPGRDVRPLGDGRADPRPGFDHGRDGRADSRPGFDHGRDGRGFERGGEVRRFDRDHLARWRAGGWHHEWYNGRYGWWWEVDGVRYWYDQPVYPYPLVVSETVVEVPSPVQTMVVPTVVPIPVVPVPLPWPFGR